MIKMSYKPLTAENCKEFKNFKYSEFKCHCGGKYCNGYPVPFSYDLAKNLQTIRTHFGKPLIITSPLRCETWNSKQGGVKNSKHKKGWACDFYVKGISYNALAKYVKTLPYFNYCYRINKNQDVIHYDITPPDYTEPKADTKEELINSLNAQILDLNSKIKEQDSQILNLKSQISEKEATIEELNEKLINSTCKHKLLYKCEKDGKYKVQLFENEVLYIESNN
nr:MAG TPA: peptidase [Caudoviricetes sp.]